MIMPKTSPQHPAFTAEISPFRDSRFGSASVLRSQFVTVANGDMTAEVKTSSAHIRGLKHLDLAQSPSEIPLNGGETTIVATKNATYLEKCW